MDSHQGVDDRLVTGSIGIVDRKAALALAMLSSFLTPFMASSINVALPTISDEFSMSTVEYSWVATSYLLAAAALLVPFGRIADIKGRKRIFLAGMWLFAVASVLCALAPSSFLLISFRFIQGFGGAMIFGTSIAILTSVYPPHERGKALGLTISVTYIGLSAGPVLGGFLTGWVGWRSIFLVLLPGVAAVLWIGTVRLKGEWAEACGEEFDLNGSIIYAASLTAVVVGFTMLPDMLGILISLLGAVGIGSFVAWELRVKFPVLNMTLFRHNRPFAFSNLAALVNYSATFAVAFLMSFYLEVARGYSEAETGLVLISQTIVMASFSPIAGKLSDVVEPQIVASVGMGFTTLGLVLLSFVNLDTEVWTIVAYLAILGFGFALFSSPNTNAIMGSVERRQYGVASATVGTMRLVGQVLSIGIATIFLSIYIGDVQITPDVVPQFMDAIPVAFDTFAVMCFVGVFASLARGRVKRSLE
jgi:EmrB/QacA subfamily drug resistance transporter